MSKVRVISGRTEYKSVAFFCEDDYGFEATRQKDGTILTRRIDGSERKYNVFLGLMIGTSLLIREIAFHLNLPSWTYHINTVLWGSSLIWGIFDSLANFDERMYHGAEHKVLKWYTKYNMTGGIECIRNCSRISNKCGTNELATIVTFQIISSVYFKCFDIHIPEIFTLILPFFLYKYFPFNILGLFSQLFTTATPYDEHIQVAQAAIMALCENEKNSLARQLDKK